MTDLEIAIQTFIDHGVGVEALYRTIQGDRRAARWRVRMRLIDAAGECEADSDPHLPAKAPGADVVTGLHGVADWAGGIIAATTGEPSAAIAAALRAKVPSLRVAIARHRGEPRVAWSFIYPSAQRGDLHFTVYVSKYSEAPGVARRAA